jgi:hypothetical protein
MRTFYDFIDEETDAHKNNLPKIPYLEIGKHRI